MSAKPIRYGVVGRGWRADFYLRLARQLPERFRCIGAVVRDAAVGSQIERQWGVPTYRRIEQLVAAAAPEVVVTSVPREANPHVVEVLVGLGTAVLSETPPAPDAAGLRQLWTAVGPADLVQVAEQHPFLPIFAALRALIRRGALGDVTSAQVSWTHDYHAMAVLRCLLGIACEPIRISAIRSAGPLLEGPDRDGWPAEPRIRTAGQTIAVLDDAGRTGLYDFTDGQWFNPLRRRHVILRGSRGEVVGKDVTWAGGDGRPQSARIERRQTGLDGNLEGADLERLTWCGDVLYRNPFVGARMADEEIAIATCLEQTAQWRRGCALPPYPLADACQDHLLSLAVHTAADTRKPVVTKVEAWAGAARGAAEPASGVLA